MDVAEWILLGSLTGLSLYDIKTKTVPVVAVMLFGGAALVHRLFLGVSVSELIMGLIPGVLFLLLAFVTKESIGTGDGMVVCALGIFCGLVKLVAVLGMALVFSGALAVVLLVLRRVDRKTELPFLPCLLAGYMICLWW